jgi:Zn finger protein HypA/HybF involved in hydrogenase expression
MSSDSREIKPVPQNEADVPSAKLVFFCKKCEELVDAKQTRKKFTFRCAKCGKDEIAFGTEESIRNHYRIKG